MFLLFPNQPNHRHGDPVHVYHRAGDLKVGFRNNELRLKRVSYANLYGTVQLLVGRFSGIVGCIGFLGNEPLTESTLILDAKAHEYLLVQGSLPALPEKSE